MKYIYIYEILTSNGILNCIFMGYEWNIDITLVSRRLVVVSIGIIHKIITKKGLSRLWKIEPIP